MDGPLDQILSRTQLLFSGGLCSIISGRQCTNLSVSIITKRRKNLYTGLPSTISFDISIKPNSLSANGGSFKSLIIRQETTPLASLTDRVSLVSIDACLKLSIFRKNL